MNIEEYRRKLDDHTLSIAQLLIAAGRVRGSQPSVASPTARPETGAPP